jgi:cytochrome c
MKLAVITACLAVMSAFAASGALAAGDARTGQALFEKQCARCHDTRPGKHSDKGRSLNGVIGRKAGGFVFYSSPAMMKSGINWSEESLDKYLADPRKFIPGSWMSTSGLDSYKWQPSKQERDDVIAFLASISKGQAR